MAEKVGIAVAGKTIAVPVDRLRELVKWMLFVDSPLSARARIERALAANTAVIRFDKYEKAAAVAVLNDWLDLGGRDEMGAELREVLDEMQREVADAP